MKINYTAPETELIGMELSDTLMESSYGVNGDPISDGIEEYPEW